MDETQWNGFGERILAGESTVGTFLNPASSVSAEYGWVLVDLEQGPGTAAHKVPARLVGAGT